MQEASDALWRDRTTSNLCFHALHKMIGEKFVKSLTMLIVIQGDTNLLFVLFTPMGRFQNCQRDSIVIQGDTNLLFVLFTPMGRFQNCHRDSYELYFSCGISLVFT